MSKLLHSTLFFLDLRVRDGFFLCKYYLHANRNQFLMCCVLFSVSYLGKSVALAGCAKMIYRLPRWRKDSDGLNDAQIFGSCEHAHDREVNIEGRTSLYGVWYHAVFFKMVSSFESFIASWNGASLRSTMVCWSSWSWMNLALTSTNSWITVKFEFLSHQPFTSHRGSYGLDLDTNEGFPAS